MSIEDKILLRLKSLGADFVHFVDITGLSEKENKSYPTAILFGIVLPPDYVRKLNDSQETDVSEFSSGEEKVGELAELIAEELVKEGYAAYSQSDHNIYATGYYEESCKTTPLPHKTIAVLGGLGWIGKDNLLVTKEYGSAINLCSVLTDAPVKSISHIPMKSRCGACKICQTICPAKVIKGNIWKPGMAREELLDVYHCAECLKCMVACPWNRSAG